MKKNIKAVGVIFESGDGRILVLRRHADSREGNTWGLVGGNIDAKESNVQAAIRETSEEIGHRISPADLLFEKSYSWEHDDAFISFDVFRCKTAQDQVRIDLDMNENTEYVWALPRELHSRTDLMAGLYPILEDLYGLRPR